MNTDDTKCSGFVAVSELQLPSSDTSKPSIGARFASFWRTSHRQARNDFRQRWGRMVACLFFAGLCTCFGILYPFSSAAGKYGTACQPDGSFQLRPETFRYWSRSGFFQITLAFGNLSFTDAKIIDVVWDVGFGRGGQALLALVSWNTFVRYVTTVMETKPVTFRTYRTVFVQDQSPVFAIPRMIGDFSFRHGLHSKLAMTFMVSTMVFIWVFPTIGSAMTGYQGKVKAFVNGTDGNLIPFSAMRPLLYVIHDGDRINRTEDFNVVYSSYGIPGEPVLPFDNIYTNFPGYSTASGQLLDCNYWRATPEGKAECTMILDVMNYLNQYNASTNVSSSFEQHVLSPPILNITTLSQREPDAHVYADEHNMQWEFQQESVDLSWVSTHGSCQALSTYQWGFSFIQLNLMIVLLMLWTVGIFIMWLSAETIMNQRDRKHVAGEHKALLELADAMQSQLITATGRSAHETANLSESELRHRIAKDLNGGSISYAAPLLSNHGGNTKWGIVSYLKKEAWWFIALIIFCGVSIVGGIYGYMPAAIAVVGFAVGLIITVSVGSTHKSKGVILWWSFWALAVVPEVTLVMVVYFSKGVVRVGLNYGGTQYQD